jgi:SpoVK/Ycf46/Vps4 family AAA+-type ATPase
MDKIKENILDMIIYFIQNFESSTSNMLHTTIEGPPGVGKSKLGRILAHIYNALGVIDSKRFVRVRRTDLIGKYLGHTAHKTQDVIDKAEGGVLFIDEAYSLGSGSDNDIYSKECIDTINMNLTEKKKKLILIIAGYADELDRSFFSFNEGLKRRFPFRYSIDGYTAQEMTQIFYYMIRKLQWKLDKTVTKDYLESFFNTNKKDFNNYAGDIETVILECKITHARRVLGQPLFLHKIINKDDIESALKKFITNKKTKTIDLSKLGGMYS